MSSQLRRRCPPASHNVRARPPGRGVPSHRYLRLICSAAPSHSLKDPRHALGRRGEELALAHLERLGFAAMARNERTRLGEIDLIVFGKGILVFVEVKTARLPRMSARANVEPPLARLTGRQRARLRRLAAEWLSDPSHLRPRTHTIRFDAIGVSVDHAGVLARLDHIENAW